jgi:hypothetical protein
VQAAEMQRGEIGDLWPPYWLDLQEYGHALVKCELAMFKPEA